MGVELAWLPGTGDGTCAYGAYEVWPEAASEVQVCAEEVILCCTVYTVDMSDVSIPS